MRSVSDAGAGRALRQDLPDALVGNPDAFPGANPDLTYSLDVTFVFICAMFIVFMQYGFAAVRCLLFACYERSTWRGRQRAARLTVS